MSLEFLVSKSISIPASAEKVWDALTNPAIIKKYFFGTDAISEWKVGSPLIFRGVWEGKSYEDHGTILAMEKGKLLRYNYWSSFSGTPDIPANYANITYTLKPEEGGTLLTITQDGSKTAEARDHSGKNWEMVLENLKKLFVTEEIVGVKS